MKQLLLILLIFSTISYGQDSTRFSNDTDNYVTHLSINNKTIKTEISCGIFIAKYCCEGNKSWYIITYREDLKGVRMYYSRFEVVIKKDFIVVSNMAMFKSNYIELINLINECQNQLK